MENIATYVSQATGTLVTEATAQFLLETRDSNVTQSFIYFFNAVSQRDLRLITTGMYEKQVSYFQRVGMTPRQLVLGVLTVDRMVRSGNGVDDDIHVPVLVKRVNTHHDFALDGLLIASTEVKHVMYAHDTAHVPRVIGPPMSQHANLINLRPTLSFSNQIRQGIIRDSFVFSRLFDDSTVAPHLLVTSPTFLSLDLDTLAFQMEYCISVCSLDARVFERVKTILLQCFQVVSDDRVTTRMQATPTMHVSEKGLHIEYTQIGNPARVHLCLLFGMFSSKSAALHNGPSNWQVGFDDTSFLCTTIGAFSCVHGATIVTRHNVVFPQPSQSWGNNPLFLDKSFMFQGRSQYEVCLSGNDTCPNDPQYNVVKNVQLCFDDLMRREIVNREDLHVLFQVLQNVDIVLFLPTTLDNLHCKPICVKDLYTTLFNTLASTDPRSLYLLYGELAPQVAALIMEKSVATSDEASVIAMKFDALVAPLATALQSVINDMQARVNKLSSFPATPYFPKAKRTIFPRFKDLSFTISELQFVLEAASNYTANASQDIDLRQLGMPWEKKRLVLLLYYKRDGNDIVIGNKDVLRLIFHAYNVLIMADVRRALFSGSTFLPFSQRDTLSADDNDDKGGVEGYTIPATFHQYQVPQYAPQVYAQQRQGYNSPFFQPGYQPQGFPRTQQGYRPNF